MKGILFDNLHRGLGSVLELRQKQHSLTAGNIANVDTPNYKAKVIPFDELLQEVVDPSDFSMKTTDVQHLASGNGDPSNPTIEELEAPAWVLDGNSVSLEREMVRLKENGLMFKSVTKTLSKRLDLLKYAASNGKG